MKGDTQFIGKEKDCESRLGDFGVRKYDDNLGRFTSIDPLWEMYHGWSPYHNCRNNPLVAVDPSGLADYYDAEGKFIGSDGADNTDKYLTTEGDYKKAQSAGWKGDEANKARENKVPTKETMEKVKEAPRNQYQEAGIVEDQNGKPTDTKLGKFERNGCAASIDQLSQVNETLQNGSSPGIMIHFHPYDRDDCTKATLYQNKTRKDLKVCKMN